MFSKFGAGLALVLLLAFSSYADNPLSNYHYLADPTAFVIDSTFWIIADLDDESVSDYVIKAYYAFSSKDMVNWTDHGEVFRVPRDVSWASAAWAPAATWRNGKMYVYFPNGGGGVGVVRSSSPVGPYTDPVGHAIISGSTCDSVAWCFDPGVFVDTDGQGYLIWGGGNSTARPYGSNFSMVKLNADMISWSGSILRMTGTTNSFEAPYITKRNSTYYLSYNSQDQTIKYATSTSPTGPWNYQGVVLANPNINGTNINAYNNNHQGFAEFKGKWYAAYHDRRTAIANSDAAAAYHRSLSIDELKYNTDGTFQSLVFTNSGPAAIGNFNPYDSIPSTTSSLQKNIRSLTVPVSGAAPYSMLIPKPSGSTGSWTRISNVDFGTTGALKFTLNASSLNANNKVEIRTASATGTLAGTCSLPSTGSWASFTTTTCTVAGLTGVVPFVYLKFTGTDSTAGLKWWKFIANVSNSSSSSVTSSSSVAVSSSSVAISSSAVPQGPYSSMAVIPGTIQVENYDVGGEGVAYHDVDSINSGSVYRTDGVDITGDATSGYMLGWTQSGEWLEYSVQVDSSATYNWEARVSSGADNAAFSMLFDGILLSDTVAISNTGDWATYTTVTGTTPVLTAGQHILRLVVDGSYFNIDWIKFQSELPIPVRIIQKARTNPTIKAIRYDLLGRKSQGIHSKL